jgi:putative transcriptional regulator
MSMQGLFEKVDLPLARASLTANPRCCQGGPVHTERGFVLHEAMVQPDDAGSAGGQALQDGKAKSPFMLRP